MAGGEGGGKRMKWLDSIIDSMDMNFSKLREWRTEEPGVLQSMGLQRDMTEQLNNNSTYTLL